MSNLPRRGLSERPIPLARRHLRLSLDRIITGALLVLIAVLVVLVLRDLQPPTGSSRGTSPAHRPWPAPGSPAPTKLPRPPALVAPLRTAAPSAAPRLPPSAALPRPTLATARPTLSPNDATDVGCTVVETRDYALAHMLAIHLRTTEGARCVRDLEPVHPLLPLKNVAVRCPRNARRWRTFHEHIAHIDWEEMQRRKQSVARLYVSSCRPRPPANPLLFYIDIGCKHFQQSVKYFLDTYPNAKNFVVHAFDTNARFGTAKGFIDGAAQHVFFHHAYVWNETGFVTFLLNHPAPSPTGDAGEPVQEALDDRPLPFVFHRDEHGLAREDIPLGFPDENLYTVPSIAITELLSALVGVQEKDFVALKLDVDGKEQMLLEMLLTQSMLHLIDELFLVCHNIEMDPVWPIESQTPASCQELILTLRDAGVFVHEWYA